MYNSGMTNNRTILFAIWLGATLLTLDTIAGCKKQPQAGGQKTEDRGQISVSSEQKTDNNSSAPSPAKPKLTLNEIIKRGKSWDSAYTRWYGKESPNFTVVDINGQSHTLSQYKGKNVLLVFWATWCPPCLAEIPHIIELRKEISEDKLAILGISFVDQRNTLEAIRRLVKANPKINYTIAPTNIMTIPNPYAGISVLPTSFFIDPQGKIKLAAEGLVPLPDSKAIIEAER
jgi:thiol-disulfide isomerase/thioredoxin